MGQPAGGAGRRVRGRGVGGPHPGRLVASVPGRTRAGAACHAASMQVLPDIVGADPLVVFCGLAGAESTKPRDHFYESPGNNFWAMLHQSGLTRRRLRPDEDRRIVEFGLGLTDLVGWWAPPRVDVDDLVAKVDGWQPDWLAFTSKDVAGKAAGALGHRKPGLGPA